MKKYIYGAGTLGKAFIQFLKKFNLEKEISGFVDKNYASIKEIDGIRVLSPGELEESQSCCLLAISDFASREEVGKKISEKGVEIISLDYFANMAQMDKVEFNRQFCALFHVDNMDDYFSEAENSVNAFWLEESSFYRLFKELDLTNVVE